MKPIRFGLIGCSSIARRRFAPAVRKSTVARLERIGSRDVSKAEQFSRDFNCPKTGSYEDVLTDPDVDAVYISTPPGLHEPWARAAAEHGKHILCEKPAFPTYRTALELVELCRRSEVRLMEGYMFSYHPQHAIVRSLLKENRIGAPRLIQGEFALPWPAEGSYRLQRELGGGVFLDAAGYPVALAMLLYKSEPASVYCEIKTDEAGVDRAVSMILNFPGGEIAHALAMYGLRYRGQYLVRGAEGSIEAPRAFAIPPENGTEIILETATEKKIIPIAPADQFLLMMEDFCKQINQPSPSQTFEEHLLRQHAVMEAAMRSHTQQKPVLLSEIRS
jgi:predicted dehydrogenase